jgi:hypothetical protein
MEKLLATLDSEPGLYEKKRPNKHTHRVEWNDHMEHDIAVQYAGFSFSSAPRCARLPEILRASQCSDIIEINSFIATVTKQIMHDEGFLVALAVENLLYGTFETDWKDLDAKRKKEIVCWRDFIEELALRPAITVASHVPK